MLHWLRLHRLALGATLKLLASNPLASALNLLVVGIAVALPLGLYALVANLQQLAGALPTDPQANIFMKTGATAMDEERFEAALRGDAAVASFHRVGRDAALETLQQSSGMAELAAGLDSNPLPDAYVLTLRSAEPATLDATAAKLRTDPAVDTVQMDSDWMRRLSAIVALGREATSSIAALLGAGLLLITLNLIRMQILTRGDEIEVSKLMGATNSFIRRPFLYFALLQGALGGLVGVGVVALALNRLSQPVSRLATLYGDHFALALPTAGVASTAIVIVIVLSLLGASISVRKHLRLLDA